MKRLLAALSLSALALFPQAASAADAPGLITEDIHAPHHGSAMNVAVWYPGTGGTAQTFAENPVFQGGEVLREPSPCPESTQLCSFLTA